MEYIRVTSENIRKEHICCAISNNDDVQVASKKCWMAEQFEHGLCFIKSSERGKCFIEYIPAEYAWLPIEAEGYMHINCFWVSGSLKGHGYANDLLSLCMEDARAKGKLGLCVLSSAKKKPFLSDPKYLKYKGFRTADCADGGFELLYLPFAEDAPVPRFSESARHPHSDEPGLVLYYTNQCPFNAKYVPIIESMAREHGAALTVHHIRTLEDARAVPAPVTTYAFFRDGQFLTHECLSEKKFLKLLEESRA